MRSLVEWMNRPNGSFHMDDDMYLEAVVGGRFWIRRRSRQHVEDLSPSVCKALRELGAESESAVRQALVEIYDDAIAEVEQHPAHPEWVRRNDELWEEFDREIEERIKVSFADAVRNATPSPEWDGKPPWMI